MSDRPRDVQTAILPGTVQRAPLLQGTRLAAYTIRKPIGEGGMGATIYEAVQDSPQRLVALKVLPAAAGHAAFERFTREADALARVQHRHVVAIFESGVAPGGDAFLAMELVPAAQTLDDYIRDKQPSLRQRVRLMIEVCSAVAEAHRLGLVHRDLKPGNILIGQSGEAKLVDFGITTSVNADGLGTSLSPVASLPHGTPAYMSPEQARSSGGTIDARSDVFSLGAILFELLTNTPLRTFDAADHKSDTWLRRVLDQRAPTPSSRNRKLRGDADRVLLRALSHEPGDRYDNAAQLETALRELLADLPSSAVAEPVLRKNWRTLRRTSRRHPWATKILLTLLGASIGFASLVPGVFDVLGTRPIEAMLVRQATGANQGDRFVRVVRVPIDNAFDAMQMSAAMTHHNISPEPTSRASIRRLHGVVVDRLVEADVKAIAFDLTFLRETEGDADFAAAIKRAIDHNIPVLAVAGEWDETTTSTTLRPMLRLGGAEVAIGGGAWQMHLGRESVAGEVMPGLGLLTFLAARSPATQWQATLDGGTTMVLRGTLPSGGVDAQGQPRRRVSEVMSISPTTIEGPVDGVPLPGAPIMPKLRVLVPDDAALARSTLRYADCVSTSPDLAAIRAKVFERVAVIGDLRTTGETRYDYADGRKLTGFDALSTGIELLCQQQPALATPAGPIIFSLLACAAIGTLLGSLAIVRRRWFASVLAVIAITVVGFAIGLVAATQLSWLINPVPLWIAALASGVAATGVARATREPLT